jgi:hypothetical protein
MSEFRRTNELVRTRLTIPDDDDYKKLIRVMKYLQETIGLPLVLSSNGTNDLQWWIDASYAVHYDMIVHTGSTMSMGKGSIHTTSTKQKMTDQSSSESEIVRMYDLLPQIIRTAHFLKDQRFPVNNSVLHQDNKSAMLLETNGRKSSTKRTRHMNICYFYIKDNVDTKGIKD